MRRAENVALISIIFLLVMAPAQAAGQQGYIPKDMSIVVLRDSSVDVQYAVQVNQSLATIELVGFDQSLASTLKVQNNYNATVPYSRSGDSVTVSETPGTIVVADYNSFKLTSKNGAIWTLLVDSPVSWSVSFPPDTNITGWSIQPEYIYKGTPPYFVFPEGNVSVRYQLSYETPRPGLAPIPSQYAIAAGLAAVAGGSSFVIYRRYQWRLKGRRLVAKHESLNEEEKRIILFLSKSNGKAFEIDVARALELSRTSAWRHVRNLEDQGLVVTEKLGSQNLVRMKP